MLEAAILAYKQRNVKILEMSPNQLLIYMIKMSFVPNFKPLPHLSAGIPDNRFRAVKEKRKAAGLHQVT